MIGQTVSHYKILDKLGEGGMGVVYKAQDMKLKRTVALKLLSPGLAGEPEANARFIHEAQTASALDHPNICTIYEIDRDRQGRWFIAMAYYEGEALKEKIKRGALKLEDAIEIVLQVAQGLAKAHERGIIHRDIKPANVIITDDGVAKLLDFGLAKLAGQTRLTKTGATLGTAAYMSPEQTMGEEVEQRTDIWSLGVVLFEMATGQLPFKGGNEQATIYSILNKEPGLTTPLQPAAPPELEQILKKALAKKPEERYPSMTEMLVDLNQLSKKLQSGLSETGLGKIKPRWSGFFYRRLPVAAILVLLFVAASYFWQRADRKGSGTVPVSPAVYRIAVLPFANISSDPADEYLADGMTDELISTLSKISGFRVIARTSVMQYKSRPKSIAEVGRELRVGSVLEGSVRKSADQLRITAKLVNVKNQEPVWSQDYDLPFGDVFGVQTDVAQRVAEALQVGVQSGEKRRLERKPTENLEAYKLCLKGRYYVEKLTKEGADKALEYFEGAIDLDPTYALAYAGLSDVYYRYSNVWWAPKEVMPKARAAALKALELDESLAEAHTSFAVVKAFYDWDWLAAEKEFQRSIELNPGNASAHQMYGILLGARGWSEKALAELKLAQELDPLSTNIAVTALWPFCFAPPSARQYDRAISELQKVIQFDPDFQWAHAVLGMLYREKKMFPEAIAELKQAVAMDDNAYNVAYLGSVYAKAGMKAEAQKLLADLIKRSKSQHIASMALALLYAGMNEKDSTLVYLQKAYEARDEDMVRLNVEPLFDGLRGDPRFTALVRKMGLDK